MLTEVTTVTEEVTENGGCCDCFGMSCACDCK